MSDYMKDPEVDNITRELIIKYPELLKHIEPDRLLCAREISRSQKKGYGTCRPVKPPYNLLNPNIMYIIVVYHRANWDDLNNAHKAAVVMHQLLHISPEFDGSLVQHDISDFSFLVDNLGSDYLGNGQTGDLLKREASTIENLDAPEDEGEISYAFTELC